MTTVQAWYKVSNPDEIDSPALLIFPDRVKYNIDLAIKMAGGGSNLRPHIKTHKCPDVARLMLDAGITKFKCATIAEAELLGLAGAPDVLLAYQPTGPKLARFVRLVEQYPATQFSLLTDNLKVATEQATALANRHLRAGVYVDLNVGMNRTGISPGEAAAELYRYCVTLDSFDVKGLHAYDGHIRNVDIVQRTIACEEAFAPVMALQQVLGKEGLPEPLIIAGGSHTFPIHCKRKNIECSPGTFVYWDKGNSDYCPEQHFLWAAILMTRIISLPAPGVICTDLGHKSVSAENPLANRVHLLNAPDLVPVGQSEEHLVLQAPATHTYHPGDVLYAVPYHVCPTVALYETAHTIGQGKLTGHWRNLARDRFVNV